MQLLGACRRCLWMLLVRQKHCGFTEDNFNCYVAGKNENEEKRELIFREDGQGDCSFTVVSARPPSKDTYLTVFHE